jgi:hypothetical protein
VSTILAPSPKTAPRHRYRPREPDILQRLFRERFCAFAGLYDEKYAGEYGKFRLPLIERAAAENWYGLDDDTAPAEGDAGEELTVTDRARRKAWARLLAKVYEIDVFCCPKCGGKMSVVAIIRNPQSIREIIACLETKGRGPP